MLKNKHILRVFIFINDSIIMGLEEFFVPLFIGIFGALIGAFISPHVQHIFGKRLLLTDKILQSKIRLYEDISESVISLWNDISTFYSTIRTNSNEEEIKNSGKEVIESHKRYFRTFAKLIVYSNKQIYNKANEIVGSTSKMIELLATINSTNRETNFIQVDELQRTSQIQITELANMFRDDLKIDKVNFGDKIF